MIIVITLLCYFSEALLVFLKMYLTFQATVIVVVSKFM